MCCLSEPIAKRANSANAKMASPASTEADWIPAKTKSTPASTSTEWILWEHKLVEAISNSTKHVENDCEDQQIDQEHVEQQLREWQAHTSEVAHFFKHPKKLYSCDTTHVPSPSKSFSPPLPKGQLQSSPQKKNGTNKGYSLFKKGILPEWEDSKNASGGSWFVRQYIEPAALDRYWKNLVAGLVDKKKSRRSSEGKRQQQRRQRPATAAIFDHINGIRIGDKTFHNRVGNNQGRAMYKIEVWIDTTDPIICEEIRTWMLAIMLDGSRKHQHRPLRTHWKSFTVANKTIGDDNSVATASTVASSRDGGDL